MQTPETPVVETSTNPFIVENSENSQLKASKSNFSPSWPWIMCFIRLPLLLGCVLLSWLWLGNADLAQNLVNYNLVILVDIVCLVLIAWLIHKEGLSVRSLLCINRQYLLRDLLLGIGLFFFSYILIFGLYLTVILVMLGMDWLHSSTALQIAQVNSVLNPLGLVWHIIITILILPITTALSEELVFRAYVQPRLQVMFGSKWLAITVMAIGFGSEHLALSLFNWQLALASFGITFFVGVIFGVFYLLTKQRLLPLIIVHWQSNLLSLGLVPLLLSLFLK